MQEIQGGEHMADHLNNIERTLIDNLRTGTYKTATSTATAWSSSDVHVFVLDMELVIQVMLQPINLI